MACGLAQSFDAAATIVITLSELVCGLIHRPIPNACVFTGGGPFFKNTARKCLSALM